MSGVDLLLAETRKERGYTECPRDDRGKCIYTGHSGPGQNHNKFALEARLTNGTYWCGGYTSALLIRTNADVAPGALTLSTRANLAAWKRAGRFVAPSQIQPGDVIFYHLTGRNGTDHSIPDHTGFCIEAPSNGKLVASEGNTSNSEYGSQDNGGGVFDRTRSLSLVIGAGRPIYPSGSPLPGLEHLGDTDMPTVVHFGGAIFAVDYDMATATPRRRTFRNPSQLEQILGGRSMRTKPNPAPNHELGDAFEVLNDQFEQVYQDLGPV